MRCATRLPRSLSASGWSRSRCSTRSSRNTAPRIFRTGLLGDAHAGPETAEALEDARGARQVVDHLDPLEFAHMLVEHAVQPLAQAPALGGLAQLEGAPVVRRALLRQVIALDQLAYVV